MEAYRFIFIQLNKEELVFLLCSLLKVEE